MLAGEDELHQKKGVTAPLRRASESPATEISSASTITPADPIPSRKCASELVMTGYP